MTIPRDFSRHLWRLKVKRAEKHFEELDAKSGTIWIDTRTRPGDNSRATALSLSRAREPMHA